VNPGLRRDDDVLGSVPACAPQHWPCGAVAL